jgi:hypothetical protein
MRQAVEAPVSDPAPEQALHWSSFRAARDGLDGLPHDRASERGDRRGSLEVGLGIHLAQLHGSEPRLRPGIPPHHRVVHGASARPDGVEAGEILVP